MWSMTTQAVWWGRINLCNMVRSFWLQSICMWSAAIYHNDILEATTTTITTCSRIGRQGALMLTSNSILEATIDLCCRYLNFWWIGMRSQWAKIVVRHSFIMRQSLIIIQLPLRCQQMAAHEQLANQATAAIAAATTFAKPSRSHTKEGAWECSYNIHLI